MRVSMGAMRCCVCHSPGDNIASDCREVYLEDDSHKTVYVGPTCFKRIEKAGSTGVESFGGGRRVFFTYDQASAYCKSIGRGCSACERRAGTWVTG